MERVSLWKQRLQKEENLSENSARSEIIGVQSFFSYYNVRLQLRGKLPNVHMKLDVEKLTADDLRALYKFNDLTVKTWIAFSRDCAARIGDLLDVQREQIKPEFLIKSEKKNIVGKVFLSDETIDSYWDTVYYTGIPFLRVNMPLVLLMTQQTLIECSKQQQRKQE